MSEKIIAQVSYSNTVESLIEILEQVVALTPEEDSGIIDVTIAPQIGWQGETAGKDGTVHLIEETLSDGSIVYNVEIF